MSRHWSLSTVVAFWTAIAIGILFAVYSVFRAATSTEESLSNLFLNDLWQVFVLAGFIHGLTWVIFRHYLLKPIERINGHLYRIGAGHHTEIKLKTKVREMDRIVDGINRMVHRMEFDEKVTGRTTAGPQIVVGDESAGGEEGRGGGPEESLLEDRLSPVFFGAPALVLGGFLVLGVVGFAWKRERTETREAAVDIRNTLDGIVGKVQGLSESMNQLVERARERDQDWETDKDRFRERLDSIQEKLDRASGLGETTIVLSDADLASRIGELEKRLDTEKRLGLSELSQLKLELDAIYSEAGQEQSAKIEALTNRLDEQVERLAEVKEVTDEQSNPLSGFWGAVTRFASYAEQDFESIRGNATRPDRDWTEPKSLATETFPGARSTAVWGDRGQRWCEVIFQRNPRFQVANIQYQEFREFLFSTLPPGWTTREVKPGDDYRTVLELNGPEASFRLALYDFKEGTQRIWVTALEFGR